MQFLVDRRFIWSGLLAAALLAAPALFVLRTAHAAPASAAAARSSATSNEQPGTTSGDQVDLAVTVYNSNLALVRDVRQINLPTGEFRLRFMDIAASINPATVHFRSLSEPARLGVLEQNYEYDLLEPQKLLQIVLVVRSEEHTSELQSRPHLVCRLLLEKKQSGKPHGCCNAGSQVACLTARANA